MSDDKAKLLGVRKSQLDSMSEMVESLREENNKLKKDNEVLSEIRGKLSVEEETLDIRLKSILR